MGGRRKHRVGNIRRWFSRRKQVSKIAAVAVCSMALGAGLSLLYVYAHPITVEGKIACMFMLPDAFMIPKSS